MEFRIADTFTASLAHLTNEEQKAVKTTAFDLQINPAKPGMNFHKIERARDPNFWSLRVSRDIRIIVHRSESGLLLCYVAHHDDAYRWVARRKLETHPKTGAAQLVEIRETVQEIRIPKYIEVELPKPALFSEVSDEELLSYGVPAEWLQDVRQANEDSLLELADHLPAEAAEALLSLAVGEKPPIPEPAAVGSDPFAHPDARRRFRTLDNVAELERALNYPWEKWSVFLHPAQRELVEQDYTGPVRIAGSAGTGKTVVALHRAVHLVRSQPNARVLLTTFSDTLANALRTKLRCLISHEPRLAERLEIYALNEIGRRLYQFNFGQPQFASGELVKQLILDAAAKVEGHKLSLHFLLSEWEEVIDALQLETWEAYRDIVRLGRKTRLPESRRVVIWSILEQVRAALKSSGKLTWAGLFHRLSLKLTESKLSPFEFIVVDEAQDVSMAQLEFLAALGSGRRNSLFFTGDLGQRIFQQPFSWKSLGVDLRGRSYTLKINYRTSHQIRKQADRLLGPEIADVDGNIEQRRGTISVFNGPQPTIQVLPSTEAEIEFVSQWISSQIKEGISAHEIGVFVRSINEINRSLQAVETAGFSANVLDENVLIRRGQISVSTMHLAKGLEFRAVVVMACDDEVIPSQKRIETVTEETDLEEVYHTERHLLYVACTRARDQLLVTGVAPASEFLDDLEV